MEDLIEKRCGEIFLTIYGSTIIFCTLCDNKYESHEDYVKHLNHQHLSEETEVLENEFETEISELYEDSEKLEDIETHFLNVNIEETDIKQPQNIEDYSFRASNYENKSNGNDGIIIEIENPVSIETLESIEICTKTNEGSTYWNTMNDESSSETVSNNEEEFVINPIRQRTINQTTADRKFKCAYCEYSCADKSNYRRHIQRHLQNKPYKCNECGKSFYTRTELNTHIRSHTGERPFVCKICGRGFTTSSKRTKHLRSHNSDHNSVQKGYENDTDDTKLMPQFLPVNVDDIKTIIKTDNSYDTFPDDKIASNFQEYSVPLRSIKVRDTTKERKYKCPHCNYACSDKSNIKGHIKRHSSYKKYKCTECEKGFHTRTELETHFRTHTGERPFLCTICGNTFKTSYKLNSHIKRHKNNREKECSICFKQFFDAIKLREHLYVHSEKREHQCTECKASFKHKMAFKNHLKVHENNRSYQCSLCDSKFNQHAGLYIHMKNKH